MGNELTTGAIGEVLKPFTKCQQNFLILRMMGLPNDEALRCCGIKYSSEKVWEASEKFKGVLEHLTSEAVSGSQENRDNALAIYMKNVGIAVMGGLTDLALRINNWDKEKREDKPHIMAAARMFAGGMKKGKDDAGSYDEIILKRHMQRE